VIANHVIDLHPDCWGPGGTLAGDLCVCCKVQRSCNDAWLRGGRVSRVIAHWRSLPWHKRLFWWVVSL
jgi:hypothetical protein